MAIGKCRSYVRISAVKRAQVIALRNNGLSIRKIGAQLKMNTFTVQSIFKKWNSMHTIEDLPKKGRPKKLNDRTKRLLCRMMLKGEVSSATELAQIARTQYDTNISPQFVRNILHEYNIMVRRTIRKPKLTPEHKRIRLKFARAHRNWTVNDWKKVIFSDESIISAYPLNTRHETWIKSTNLLDPRLLIPTVQGGGSRIMVWSCISKYGFHDMVHLENNVNSINYVEVLDQYLLPIIGEYFGSQPCIFQQDNASIHTAHVVQDFFESENIDVLQWPPHSPDLNIIEHTWYYLKKELQKLPPAGNKEMLWDQVIRTMNIMWSEKITANINDLYESMPRRIEAIIRNRGGNTKY
jgi:transposase